MKSSLILFLLIIVSGLFVSCSGYDPYTVPVPFTEMNGDPNTMKSAWVP